MTVHHHRPSHHVAALSGIAVASGLDLSRVTAQLDAHHNGLDVRNGNDNPIGLGLNLHAASATVTGAANNNNNSANGAANNNNNNGAGDSSTTTPHRSSRFMITDILAGASSPQSQEPPGSPPSTPRDLSVRHQSRSSLNNSTVDEDSDASHHDGASVSSNGEYERIIAWM